MIIDNLVKEPKLIFSNISSLELVTNKKDFSSNSNYDGGYHTEYFEVYPVFYYREFKKKKLVKLDKKDVLVFKFWISNGWGDYAEGNNNIVVSENNKKSVLKYLEDNGLRSTLLNSLTSKIDNYDFRKHDYYERGESLKINYLGSAR